MGLVLTQEQAALKDAARKFAQQKMPVTEMRRLRDSNDATGFDKKIWQEMAQLGWAGILVPEDFGGAGLGYQELGVVFEELGRTLGQSPLLSTAALAVTAINAAGSEAQKKALLEKIATGELLVALAVDEGPRHRPAHIALKVEKAGGAYKLSGEKTLVFEGNAADQFIVAARTSGRPGEKGGITLFLVAADAPGVRVTPTHLVDSRRAANVRFEDVEAGEILGTENGGYEVLEKTLDAGRALLAAEMLGGAQEVFERTVEYMKERKQFDAVIGSFQALKHRAAVMFCELELAKSVVADALSALDEDREDAAQAVSTAKAQLCETYELVSNEGVQLHGGIGMTDEHDVGLFLKRARVAQHAFGGEAFHRERFAELEGF